MKGFILEDTSAKRDFKGIWIPKEIWLDHNLSPTEKCLLAEIHSLDKGKGCYAGNKYLGDFIGKSKGTVANILVSLRKRGYIEDLSINGEERHIKAVPFVALEAVGGS